MVEVGTWILFTKVTPKKTAIKKNSTVSDRELDSLSDNVEFFDLRIFLHVNFCGKILLANGICPKHFIVNDLYLAVIPGITGNH
jgi:hypothetical protein